MAFITGLITGMGITVVCIIVGVPLLGIFVFKTFDNLF